MAVAALLLSSLPSLLATDTALLTGGFNGLEGARDGCELLSSSCSLPSLPWSAATNRSGRSDHVTLLTEDGLVLACGGEAADGTDDLSCASLDLTTGPAELQAWQPHSTLDVERIMATAVVLPGLGAFIPGGFKQVSTSFLPAGGSAWEAGPVLPGPPVGEPGSPVYYGICSVLLSATEFLVIGGGAEGVLGGTRVAQYDAARGDFQSWPSLYTQRWGHACARLGDTVVVAGGVSVAFTIMDSTTLLDLATGEERQGGRMASPRTWFGMVAAEGALVVFGGTAGLDPLDSVEQWDEGVEEWVGREDRMATAMYSFAAIPATVEEFCRTA